MPNVDEAGFVEIVRTIGIGAGLSCPSISTIEAQALGRQGVVSFLNARLSSNPAHRAQALFGKGNSSSPLWTTPL